MIKSNSIIQAVEHFGGLHSGRIQGAGIVEEVRSAFIRRRMQVESADEVDDARVVLFQPVLVDEILHYVIVRYKIH